ncbi:MAG: hypothetical protein AB7N91_14445 [Candidatus Tectimicrobiota bacterium]
MPEKPPEESETGAVMHVLVCVEDTYRPHMDTLVRQVQEVGMRVSEVFALGGIIVGTVPVQVLPALQALAGVVSVEEEPTFRAY